MTIRWRKTSNSSIVLLILVVCIGCSINRTSLMAQSQNQPARPIALTGLVKALKILGGDPQDPLIERIKERGVNFDVSADVAKQLRDAGANEEVIKAARENYRGETVKPTQKSGGIQTSVPPFKLSAEYEKNALELFDMKQFTEASPLLSRACDGGSSKSCIDLGMMYLQGNGVQKDEMHGIALFSKACESFDSLGCYNLGVIFDQGIGVAQDKARAASIYAKACDSGSYAACSNLGNMYKIGTGVTVNLAQAISLYNRACDAGNSGGCFNLGVLNLKGDGISKDETQAALLFSKACTAGEMKGCASLGTMYLNGTGVPKDETHAESLFNQACNVGEPNACGELGSMYMLRGSGAEDEAKSVSVFSKAKEAFDQAIRISPASVSALFERGRAKFFLADLAGAATDFEQSEALNPSSDIAPYALLWLHMAKSRMGQNDTVDFAQRATKVTQGKWPRPVIDLYMDQVSEKQVFAVAADQVPERQKGQLCEANFYAGEYALFHQDLATGMARLEIAKAICPKGFFEYQGAVQELLRLHLANPEKAITSQPGVQPQARETVIQRQDNPVVDSNNVENAKRYWTDSATGLMWTREDNGQDVSWHDASNYCKNLVSGKGFKWRMPTIDELETIYDRSQRLGGGKATGGIQLTGKMVWSNSPGYNPREEFIFGFDFGHRGSLLAINYNGIRALCVRRSSDYDKDKESEPSSAISTGKVDSGEWRFSLNGNIHRIEISDSYVTITPVTGRLTARIPIKNDKNGKQKIAGQWQSDNSIGYISITEVSQQQIAATMFFPNTPGANCTGRIVALIENMNNVQQCKTVNVLWQRQ